jgi:hypothetical protein
VWEVRFDRISKKLHSTMVASNLPPLPNLAVTAGGLCMLLTRVSEGVTAASPARQSVALRPASVSLPVSGAVEAFQGPVPWDGLHGYVRDRPI